MRSYTLESTFCGMNKGAVKVRCIVNNNWDGGGNFYPGTLLNSCLSDQRRIIINGLVFLRQGYQLTTQMLMDTGNSFSRALLPLEATGTDYTSAAAATPAGPKPNHYPVDGQEKVEKDKSTMKITR